jgi:hypothetical protein
LKKPILSPTRKGNFLSSYQFKDRGKTEKADSLFFHRALAKRINYGKYQVVPGGSGQG